MSMIHTYVLPEVIEDAAIVCSMKAAWWDAHRKLTSKRGPAWGVDDQTDTAYAARLADAAFMDDHYNRPISDTFTMADAWAEAEAMIRSGWLPNGWAIYKP